jgi:hypothetical protein
MELQRLFSRGSRLSDVPDDFRGMPFWKWRMEMAAVEGERHRAKVTDLPPVADAKIVTAKDEYGMKGLRGR